MFSKGQKVIFKSLVPISCEVIGQRFYTDRYSHWDLKVLEPAFLNGQQIAFKNVQHLGIPENAIEAVDNQEVGL